MASIKEKINSLRETSEANSSDAITAPEADREREVVRVSIIGIVANAFLAAFKAFIGIVSGSIAITLDAVNNLSDAASSVITIVGTKLAGKDADKKHPFGYGRIEYLTAMVISLIVLYAGITSLKESIGSIIHPEKPDYSTVALVIVAVGLLVKIILGRFVKAAGKRLNSDSLVNSGEDATLDSIISASTLAAALIFTFSGVSLESWLGAIISVVIIKSGIDMLKDTLSEILGEKADVELARAIKKVVLKHEGVHGVYDLVLNNYGPDVYNGSLHIEVEDTMSADELDELIREISVDVYMTCRVLITAVGVYSINTKDPVAIEARKNVMSLVLAIPYVIQVHGFYLRENDKSMRFDAVISFDAPDRKAVYREIIAKVNEAYPDYKLEVAMDTDFSEE